MAMEIDPGRIASGDLTDEEIIYLQQRGKLPAHVQPFAQDELGNYLHQETKRYIEDLTIEEIEAELATRFENQAQDVPQMVQSGGELEDEDDEEEDEEDPETEELLRETYEENWTNDTRRAELTERGLATHGNKQELIDRLMRSDNDELIDGDEAEVE